MVSNNRYDGINPAIVKAVRSKARKLIGHHGIKPHELEDFEQQMLIYILPLVEANDDTKYPLSVFVAHKLRDFVSGLWRKRSACKTGNSLRIGSIEDADDVVTQELLDARSVQLSREHCHNHEHASLMREDWLSPLQQRLCEAMKRLSLDAAARELGITRWRARQEFELIKQGIRKKTENFPPIS